MKTRIFIDFWNFQLTLNQVTHTGYRLDWQKISPWLVNEASNIIGNNLTYEETHVYMSYDPRKSKDRGLRDFALNVLDRFPGIQVILQERKASSSPICPNCHKPIDDCPHCTKPLDRMIEKGVDTAIVTDLLVLAWQNSWDTAILVSSDRDFIPAVKSLAAKGYRVINAHFPPYGMDLARNCWANIDLRKGIGVFQR